MILDESIFNEADELPAAVPEEPIEVSTDIVEPEPTSGPESGEATGVADLLMNLIKDELEAVQGYNSFLATIQDIEGFADMIPVIEHTNEEENKHIGELQTLLQKVSPNAQNIDVGQNEAEEEMKEGGEEQVEEEFKGKFWEKPGYNAIDEDNTEGKARRIEKYRKLCGLDEDFVITEENLDEEAIKQISCYDLVEPNKLKAELLGKERNESNMKFKQTKGINEELETLLEEDETLEDTVDKAEKQMDNVKVEADNGQIESTLDNLYRKNKAQIKNGGRNFLNALFVGPAGTGKTARINAWAKAHNINLVHILASTMDDTDLGGAIAPDTKKGTVQRYSSTELDDLDKQDSVLFLDEYNRAPRSVRGTLLTLIQDHVIPDARAEGKQRFLPNFLFTIAAVNPADVNYNTDELDDAEQSRFMEVDVEHDPRNTMNYLVGEFDRLIKGEKDPQQLKEYKGQQALAKALLGSKQFHFQSPEEHDKAVDAGDKKVLTARTFTNLLLACDGTKENFLALWNSFCPRSMKSMAERILEKYKDVDDKANSVFKKDENEENVFAERDKNALDQLNDRFPGLNL